MRFALPALALASLCACGPANGTPDAGSGTACAPAKSPPNLLANPGFDCTGKDTVWGGIYGDYALVPGGRGGSAGQVTVTGSLQGRFGAADVVATASKPTTYCASAYMKGTTPFARLQLLADGLAQNFDSPIDGNWIRLPLSTNLSIAANTGAKLYLVFETSRATAGNTLMVDDVDVWESADGKCKESREPLAR